MYYSHGFLPIWILLVP